jgi:hypothetical protein
LNIKRERDEFMEKCRKYDGTKLKIGKGRIPKVEVETIDDDEEFKPFV